MKLSYLALLLLLLLTRASLGDDLDEFWDCKFQCEQITCYNNPYHLVQYEHLDELRANDPDFELLPFNPEWHFDQMPLPWLLQALFWDCESNCDYQCQRLVTHDRIANGDEVYQFHGKWPFWRVWGIQELASMVFSIANWAVHYAGMKQTWSAICANKNCPREPANAQLYVLLFMAMVTTLAWTFLTIFHVRDVLVTERLDYYFAGLTVLLGFYGIATRYFKLYLAERRAYRALFTLACVAAYAAHIYRLETDWLYTYNMQANIAVGVLQNILWVLHCFELYADYYEVEQAEKTSQNLSHLEYVGSKKVLLSSFYLRSPKLFSLYPLLLCFIVVVGMSMEIFDFPPVFYDLVDAHSLWHLVTIFPAYFGWYNWMVWDINENVWPQLRKENEKKTD